MANDIFIPEKIKIGYQKRTDTYTGKLAFITYYDESGILKRENSWNEWKDSKIPVDDFKNEPLSGFVLNKQAGGCSTGWNNHRKTYCRVYDPRGFEIEITIENLLYILENTNSMKGKGLEGDFIYGWEGVKLVLIPTCAPDYSEIIAYSDLRKRNSYIEEKDLIIGATYRSIKNETLIYMGKFEYHETYTLRCEKQKKPAFYFWDGLQFTLFVNLSKKIIACIDDSCVSNYSELFKELQITKVYGGKSTDTFIPYDYDTFLSHDAFYINKESSKIHLEPHPSDPNLFRLSTDSATICDMLKTVGLYETYATLNEIYKKLLPGYYKYFFKTGKIIEFHA